MRMYLTYFNGQGAGNTPLFGGYVTTASGWGSSVPDGARSIGGLIPDLRLHLQRVVKSAERLGLQCPLTVDQMFALCREGIGKSPADAELYIRPLVFGTEGLLIPVEQKSAFALIAVRRGDAAPSPASRLAPSSLRRPEPSMAPTDAKASRLYPNSTKEAARGTRPRLRQRGRLRQRRTCRRVRHRQHFSLAPPGPW